MQTESADRLAPLLAAAESSGIHLHASNALEELARQLADEMLRTPGDPLAPMHIVVPHPTLGRWLALQLAAELGVAANLRLELPAQYAWEAMRAAVPELPSEQPFAPAMLRWRIFDALSVWRTPRAEDPSMAELRRYLADGEPRKRFELAARLARFYDTCLLYRPDWIRAWQGGEAPHWQAQLWRELTRGTDRPLHWVDAIDAYGEALAAAAPTAVGNRVAFFGVAALSPSYVEVLRRSAGAGADLHLFLLSPCREYWADTRSRRERPRILDAAAVEAEYYTEGNELLAAWGRPARDMQRLLEDDLGSGAPNEIYREPAATTRLHAVQRDLLALRLAQDAADEPQGVAGADDSVQIHVCHSAIREAEVLHDRLLALFDAHADIEPADVLVLTSNMEAYAPAIEAVFSAADVIPFHIGRPRRRETAAIKAFLDLLALPGSRYGVQAVLAPLAAGAVQGRFGIDDGDLASLRAWLANAGVHWGIDAAHRAASGVPRSGTHTWRQGLRRLLLGYAVRDEAALVQGIAPCAIGTFGFEAGPKEYELLGRLASYCEGVFSLADWMDEEHPPQTWAERLRSAVVEPFFGAEGVPDTDAEIDAVTQLIDDFATQCRDAAGDSVSPIPFAVLRDVLGELATDASRAAPRLADGVTVGELMTGRIFPAKVVCAMGMDDDAFPRRATSASFDLVAADKRRTGDRDPRDDDRFAFLEALLAARRCFLITRTGRDQREDAAIPPSVVVSEFDEYLRERFPDAAGDWLTHHPLQPFNRRYFDGGALFSYAEPMAAAARALAGEDAAAPARFAGAAVASDAPRDEISLHDLIRFFANPTAWFVRNRLGIRLELETDGVADEEPFQLSGLGAWQAKNDILDLEQRGVPTAQVAEVMRAQGRLPQGNVGQVEYADNARQVEKLHSELENCKAQLDAEPRHVDFVVDGQRVHGAVEHFAAGTRLFWRVGAIRAKDRIEAWLTLLALACDGGCDGAPSTRILGIAGGKLQEQIITAPNACAAQEHFAAWLGAWRQGQTLPLPFYPRTSHAYVAAQSPKSRKSAEQAALDDWEYDGRDAYQHLVHGDDPLNEEFASLANDLLGPLVEACQ